MHPKTGKLIKKRKWNGIEYDELRANITRISNIGLITVNFAQPFKQQNLSEINEETLQLKIIEQDEEN